MQYILPNNIEKQRQLRGTSPKELYIPFNTGRRTGIKENTERDNFFTTRPALDKLKLSQWINNRITDGTIEISSTGLQGTGINPRIALWNTNGTLTDSAKLRLYSRSINGGTTSELFVANSTNTLSSLTIATVTGTNASASLRLTANAISSNFDSQFPNLVGDLTTSLNTYSSNYNWGQFRGVTSLVTGSNSRRLFINTGVESESFPDITLEKNFGSSIITFGSRFSNLTDGIDASYLWAGIILPSGPISGRPFYSGGGKQGTLRYNTDTRKIETYVRYGTGFDDADYDWQDVVTSVTSPTVAQHLLTSALVNGQIVWVPLAATRASNVTFTTNTVGEFTVTLPAGSFPNNSYVVNIINRSTTAVYFYNIVNKTTSGFTVKVFNNSGAVLNTIAVTIDYTVVQS